MKAYKVKFSEPYAVVDPTGYSVDIDKKTYAKNPDAEYLVPEIPFWMNRYNWKIITQMTPVEADLVKGVLIEKKKEVHL